VLLVTGATAATFAAGMEGGSGGEGTAAAAAAVARSLAAEMQRSCLGGGREDGCRRGSRKEQQQEGEEEGDEDGDDWAVELLERDVAAARRFCALPATVNVHLAETLGELMSGSRSLLVPSLDQVVLLRFERDEVGVASGGGTGDAAASIASTGGGAWHDDDGTGRGPCWLSEADRRAVRRLVAGDWRDRVSRVVVAGRPLGLRADAGGGHEEAAEPASPDGADFPGGPPRQQRHNGGGGGDPPRPLCAAPTFVCHGRDPGSVRAVARRLVRRALRGAAAGGLAGGRL
jgi:hypothetical protein